MRNTRKRLGKEQACALKVRYPRRLYADLLACANQQQTTLASIVRRAVRKYVTQASLGGSA